MFKKKYRSIIPNETDPLKNKDKNTYSESYDINGFDDKVKFEVKLLHTERANYDVSGNYSYQIKNNSHYDIEAELDFCNSLHYRSMERRNLNKSVFHTHIEPYQEIIRKKKKKKNNNKSNICKVQYNRGYKINTRIKFAFTFPSLKKQKSFVAEDHKKILDNLKIWTKFKPYMIEQLLLFFSGETKNRKSIIKKPNGNLKNEENQINNKKKLNYYEILELFSKKNGVLDNNNQSKNDDSQQNIKRDSSKLKLVSILNNEENIEAKNIFFVDETFPPCQIEYKIMDLKKETLVTPKIIEKEKEKEYKQRYIVYTKKI